MDVLVIAHYGEKKYENRLIAEEFVDSGFEIIKLGGLRSVSFLKKQNEYIFPRKCFRCEIQVHRNQFWIFKKEIICEECWEKQYEGLFNLKYPNMIEDPITDEELSLMTDKEVLDIYSDKLEYFSVDRPVFKGNNLIKVTLTPYNNLPDQFQLNNFNLLEELEISSDLPLPSNFLERLVNLKKLKINDPHPEISFTFLTNLEKLVLRHTDMTEAPENYLDGLTSLKLLDLSGNYISHLPNEIFNDLSKLEKLKLTNNKITTFHSDIFSNLQNLTNLSLRENPLDGYSLLALTKLPSDCEIYMPETLEKIIDKAAIKIKEISGKRLAFGIGSFYTTTPNILISLLEVLDIIDPNFIVTKYLLCPKCQSKESINQLVCSNCNETLPICAICKRGIAEQDKKSACPHCTTIFHYSHFYATAQSLGKCPICKEKISLTEIEMSLASS